MGHSAHRLRKALLATAALLTLSGQASSLGHLLLVRHVVCAEHGELLHGDEVAQGAAGARHTSLEDAARAALRQDVTALPEHAHTHCAVVASRKSAIVAAGAARALSAIAGVTPPSPRGAIPLRARAILLFAPKSSPPV
ncbi:MAG: hypothetical protein ACHQ53_15560 [Polyangiales bacterium]